MNEQIRAALRSFQIIQKGAEACRLHVEISPETDAVHQMLDGIVQACSEQIAALSRPEQSGTLSAALLPAMKAVLSRYPEATSASISFFATTTTEQSKAGIPIHQPLQEQAECCVRKGATHIALAVKMHDGTSIVESFPARQLVGPNFLA